MEIRPERRGGLFTQILPVGSLSLHAAARSASQPTVTTPPTNHPTDLLGPAILTLVNGVGEPGQLVFPEHPEVEVAVSGALGIILVALEKEWVRMIGQPTRTRGWLNKQRLHRAYSNRIAHQVDADSIGKYAKRLIRDIAKAFRHLAVPPALLERDNNPRTCKGTHLVRDLIIEDLLLRKPSV
jgi:hypothetical protein